MRRRKMLVGLLVAGACVASAIGVSTPSAVSAGSPSSLAVSSVEKSFEAYLAAVGPSEVTDLDLSLTLPVIVRAGKVQVVETRTDQVYASVFVPGAREITRDRDMRYYVSQPSQQSITMIGWDSFATPPATVTFPIEVPVYGPIAYADDAVWFQGGGSGASSPHLYRLDPVTGAVEDRSGDQAWMGRSQLETIPGWDGDLVLGDVDANPFTASRVELASDPITRPASMTAVSDSSLADLAGSANGTVLTAGAPGGFDEYDAATMTPTATRYVTGNAGDPVAVTFSEADTDWSSDEPTGGIIAGATRAPNKVFLYKTGEADPVSSIELTEQFEVTQLVLTADGHTLYGIVKIVETGEFALVSWMIGPKIFSRTPATFATSPPAGTLVMLDTRDVDEIDAMTVDAVPATYVRHSDTQIEVTLPEALGIGTHTIRFRTPFGEASTMILVQRFSDVDADNPFVYSIEKLVDQHAVFGFDDGTFRPTLTTSRQGLAMVLYRHRGEPAVDLPATPTFPDVPPSNPFYTAVEWAAAEGIISGYGDGMFRPGAAVSRQAAVTMILHYEDVLAFEPPSAPTFPDVPAANPFRVAVEWAAAEGIAVGYPDGTFKPGAPVSRQALSAMLWSVPQD